MQDTSFSVFDLLALPPVERDIMLHITRNGAANLDTLIQSISIDQEALQPALDSLIEKKRLHILPGGQYEVLLGRVKPKTTLPPQLWPALLAAGRTYSAQEVATLRTAIPMLQFARARLSEFSDHGPSHSLRVKSFATQLGYILGISKHERFQLRASTLFHDIGNVVDRHTHHIISQETVVNLAKKGDLPIDPQEAHLIGLICRWHRKDYDPHRVDDLHGEKIRTGLMASILRVSDAMDIDHRRSDYDEKFRQVLEFFYPQELPYWTSLEEILGLRVRCTPDVHIQVFTQGIIGENIQIEMLEKDLSSTPLDWNVQKFPVQEGSAPKETNTGNALLVFPFEANSLIMAALSQKNLLAAGYEVDLLCYPDTVNGPLWLWSEALPEITSGNFERLIVIGDRYSGRATPQLFETLQKWKTAGVSVSILNRHEANWSRIPHLLEMGVELTLGGDWAYFWGDHITPEDLLWAHIGALCTRDPTQASLDVSLQEEDIMRGLLSMVYENIQAGHKIADTDGWVSLAEPLLAGIGKNDTAAFSSQAASFVDNFTRPTRPYKLKGKVITFDGAPSETPQAYYWVLESAIEELGLQIGRETHFKAPYALAYWPVDDNEIELLAINHWREEEAIPIRFMFPETFGVTPQGNESTIHLRMPAHQAKEIITALVDVCNRD